MVREGRVFINPVGTAPAYGSNYYVTAYEVGAQVASASAGTSVTVRAGHGFAALDKFIVLSEFPATTKMRTVTVAAATTLTVSSAVSLAAGDILVNLGADTESVAGTPDYTSPGLTVYTDMDYSNAATNNTVQTDTNGRYRYWHKGIAVWELIRSSLTVPFAVIIDAGTSTVTGVDSSTDNAVARWDGTTGEAIQNSVVTISDTGATTGITTLNTSAAATLASASITAGATVGTTLAVTGATTTTGGIAGGKPYNIATAAVPTVGSGTAVTSVVTNVYVGSVFIPANATITGIQYMRGAGAVTTQKVIVALFNAAGAAVANSTTAGTTIGAVSLPHAVAFTGTYAAVGPAWYYVGVYFDTILAGIMQSIATGCGCGVVGNALGSQVFGTVSTIAAPTTFTGGVVPIASLY